MQGALHSMTVDATGCKCLSVVSGANHYSPAPWTGAGKVDKAACNKPCPGSQLEMCGGKDAAIASTSYCMFPRCYVTQQAP